MTADPLTAVLDQLAAHREHLSRLDDQLTQLTDLITTMGRTLADDATALARLETLDRQVTELAARLTGPDADGKDRHQPGPAPAWWTLASAERKPAIGELRAWVDQVYRPGYGHLAATLEGGSAYVRTPSGGLHAYFIGSAQRNGHLPAQHLDFLSAGGYVLAPPSRVRGRPYQRIRTLDGHGGLDWQAVIRLLEPERQYQQPATRPLPDYGITRLVRWVAAQREGNRNAGLFWAANRALDADPAADLNELAAAARQAGLPEQEITRTLNSARRTRHAVPEDPGRQAEGAS